MTAVHWALVTSVHALWEVRECVEAYWWLMTFIAFGFGFAAATGLFMFLAGRKR